MIRRSLNGPALASRSTLLLLAALVICFPVGMGFPLATVAARASAGTSGSAAHTVNASAAWPDSIWPETSDLWHFENLEGVILIPATLRGTTGRDTAGPMVLDTGAGYLAVDRSLATWLGVSDATQDGDYNNTESVALAPRRLTRATIGKRQIDQIGPVLTIDAEVIRNVTDRPVLGLLGKAQFANAALAIDYRAQTVAMIPLPGDGAGKGETAAPGASASSPKQLRARRDQSSRQLKPILPRDAIAVPFRLEGDGKILVTATVSEANGSQRSQTLTLIVDTGATKSVLFEESLDFKSKRYRSWPALHGMSAPTLFGAAEAFVTRIPRFELAALDRQVRWDGLDAAVIRSELRPLLSRLVGEPVDGLLGYTFLKHFRVVLDYPNLILWLSPQPTGWDDRPYEYSQVGAQVERRGGDARIVAVIEDSPADRAGLLAGDAIIAVDGVPAASLDIVALSERLEGPPGSVVEVRVRRDGAERSYRMERRWLLAP